MSFLKTITHREFREGGGLERPGGGGGAPRGMVGLGLLLGKGGAARADREEVEVLGEEVLGCGGGRDIREEVGGALERPGGGGGGLARLEEVAGPRAGGDGRFLPPDPIPERLPLSEFEA